MSRQPAARRPRGRTTGTNMLITAASLALTLSGWAVLTGTEVEPVQAVAVPLPSPAPVVRVELPVLPTLVPAPNWNDIPAPVAVKPPLSRPAVVAAAPAPRRVVTLARAPRPVTRTRSSR